MWSSEKTEKISFGYDISNVWSELTLTYVIVISLIFVVFMEPVFLYIEDLLAAGVLQPEGSAEGHPQTIYSKTEHTHTELLLVPLPYLEEHLLQVKMLDWIFIKIPGMGQ